MEKTAEEIKRYERMAIETVIRYFKEQGIRLNLSDFNLNKVIKAGKKWETSFFSFGNGVSVSVNTNGVLKKYVEGKKDNFLNYINARVEKNCISFNFSYKELDYIFVAESNVESDDEKEKLEKVKRKIEKLVALADLEKNPSEHEAISASLKVQKLLAEYHLTLAQVMGEEDVKEDVEQAVADCGRGSSIHNWRFNLADCVASGYCCKSYRVGKEKKDCSAVFYGYKEDVLSARRIYTYLYNVGNKLGNQYAKTHSYEENPYMSFCLGFTAGIRESLEKQSTALALVIQPEVEEEWEKFSENFRKASSRGHRVSGNAYEEGKVEGRNALNGNYIED